MSDVFIPADPEHIKKERAKARVLRKSQWWKRKLNERVCYYCEQEYAPEELTMDHKVPLARGGYSTKANLTPACKTCNTKKQHQLATEFSASRS